MKIALVQLVLLTYAALCNCNQLLGVLQLDSLTFNKTIRHFPYSIVKFDNGFPTGPTQQMWGELGADLSEINQILVAEVRIKDYGDKINMDLAERYGIAEKERWPEIILFGKPNKHDKKKYMETRYGGDKNLEDLKTFIKHKTGVYLNLPGCLKEFDDLASKFIKADEKGKSKIFAKAQKELSKEQEEDQPKARKYLKIMKLLQEKGPSAIADEEARIKKLLAGEKMSDEKRKDLAKSLNVLKSFGNPEKSVKDEL